MFFKFARADGPAEREGQIIVQVQQPVRGGGEGTGESEVDPAEQPILPQHKSLPPFGGQEGFGRFRDGEDKMQGGSVQFDLIPSVSQLRQAGEKGAAHIHIRECDRIFRGHFRRRNAPSHKKSGEPPVDMRKAEQLSAAVMDQPDAHGEHFVFLRCLEDCLSAEHRRDDRIGVIDPHLSARGDPVLSLPELDQPSFFLIIKINRLRVQNHVHGRRRQIVQLPISEVLLPGIGPGGKEILPVVITEAEGLGKFIEETAFFGQAHAADPADDLPFSAVVENEKKDRDQDENR